MKLNVGPVFHSSSFSQAPNWVSISRALGDCENLRPNGVELGGVRVHSDHSRSIGDTGWGVNGGSYQIGLNVKLPHSERNKIDMKVFVASKVFIFM